MAPARTKKTRTSTNSDSSTRTRTVAAKSPPRAPMQSPQKSPKKTTMGITEGQKQALIDNLQLEVTERARKLRAQYALQAQSLRTRIELRVNRIPTALRKANMGDLFERYMEVPEAKQKGITEETRIVEPASEPPVAEVFSVASKSVKPAAAPRSHGVKRTSDELESADKENSNDQEHTIPNPKKRTKAGNAASSRQVTNPSTVLSPKSANSRTFPQSPIRSILGSPQKHLLSRPVSPLKPTLQTKPMSPVKSAAAAATATAALASMIGEKSKVGRPKAGGMRKATNPKAINAATSRAKRGVEPIREPVDVRKTSNTSCVSNVSTGTTIVKNARKAPSAAAKKADAKKKGDVGARAVGKNAAANVEAPPPGRRVLRKRG